MLRFMHGMMTLRPVQLLKIRGIHLVDLYSCDWSQLTSLIVSPGVPIDHPVVHPVVAKARKVHCEVIGDIELLVRTQRWCGFIGITGTNGKSTTTALLGHIVVSWEGGKWGETLASSFEPHPLGQGYIHFRNVILSTGADTVCHI